MALPNVWEYPTTVNGPYDSRDMKRQVWSMTDGRCFYCGLHTNPFATFTIDHIRPRCLGGSDDIRNLVPCCRRCNAAKGGKSLDEWRPRKPFWFLSDEYQDRYAQIRSWVVMCWFHDPEEDWGQL